MGEAHRVHISAEHRLLDLRLGEVWQYRDLIRLFTRRSFVVAYKQTILGPLWLLLNPILTAVFYVVLFGNIAKLGTEGVPQLLFYLCGTAVWHYFSSCLTGNASTFVDHASLFGKVYFPRLVMPLSGVLSAAIRFCIQMLPAAVLLAVSILRGSVQPRFALWPLLPFLLLWLGLLGMGFGVLISGLTTKYRDLSVLVSFGMQLLMYATPVVYPLSAVPEGLSVIALLNPVTMPMELFRCILFGTGTVCAWSLLLSLGVTLLVSFGGVVLFSRVERSFVDTV